ncbi:unnamed protein product [Owenia fusiformis]|uniref:Uncharacterized protein n=1 Tax=Owenia fusiformis TaxID=6347 RepID=A0A8J1XJI8_OWEFU|nr:unnamed protein product [Owenia fusiformis]
MYCLRHFLSAQTSSNSTLIWSKFLGDNPLLPLWHPNPTSPSGTLSSPLTPPKFGTSPHFTLSSFLTPPKEFEKKFIFFLLTHHTLKLPCSDIYRDTAWEFVIHFESAQNAPNSISKL